MLSNPQKNIIPSGEPTLHDVLSSIHNVALSVQHLAVNFQNLGVNVQAVGVSVQNLAVTVSVIQKDQQDMLEAMHDYAKDNEERFQSIETSIKEMRQEMTKFVTKDYLDDKLDNFRGDIMGVMSEQNEKTMSGFRLLAEKKIFSREEVKTLSLMKPFPKKIR